TAVKEFRAEFQPQIRTLATTAPKVRPGQEAAGAMLTFRQVGAQAIAGRLKDFRGAVVRSIYFPFEIDKIHELRILAKRLRYAVELFRSCWDRDLSETAGEIATLQTSLGELHDCDVWIEYLGRRLKRISGKPGSDSLQVRAGYTWLLRHFTKKRTAH